MTRIPFFPISLYLVYLGMGKEALEGYERGLQLYPYYRGNQFRIGLFIYFEFGEYEKAASPIEKNQMGKAMIADTDAYCAAIFYHLKQYDKMRAFWNAFLDIFRKLITKGVYSHFWYEFSEAGWNRVTRLVATGNKLD